MSDAADDFLAHYGVKGMKWGKRKSAPQAENYTANQRRVDQGVFGKGGVKRINKNMVEGSTRSKAQVKEVGRQVALGGAVLAAHKFGPTVANLAVQGLNDAVSAKKASNGRKAAANIFANDKGLTSYQSIDLSYNSASNIWE